MSSGLGQRGFLIDQQIEVQRPFLQSKQENSNQSNFQSIQQITRNVQSNGNTNPSHFKSNGSYQVILQQSLTTQDKPFLYQILTQSDLEVIRNSIQNLSSKRVIQLLRMIKSILEQYIKLGKGQDNCLSISLWLQMLIRIHLSTIVSNPENKQIITGIRKFIQKKTKSQKQLKQIKQHILSQETCQQLHKLKNQKQRKVKKNAKFDYIQEQKQIQEQSIESKIDDDLIDDEDMEGLQIDDLMDEDLIENQF